MSGTSTAIGTISTERCLRANGKSLKLRNLTVLAINAAASNTTAIHTIDQRQSPMGTLIAWTHATSKPAAARWTRQSPKIPGSSTWSHSLNIKSGQSPRAAHCERQCHPPADFVNTPDIHQLTRQNVAHSPGKCQDRRCHSETHHVGKRIELFAEFAAGGGSASHEPVEGIEDDGEADGLRGVIQI